jgi:peroxiredoxin
VAIEAGRPAPLFTLTDADGAKVALMDLKGQDVILYILPQG